MAKIEEVERRLLNWARWKHGAGSGGLGFSRSSWDTEPSGTRYREATIPTVDCEASQTDAAVNALEDRLKKTVIQVYLTNASPAIDARELGCGESAVRYRVAEAHRRIANWFTDLQQRQAEERRRVELLQRTTKT